MTKEELLNAIDKVTDDAKKITAFADEAIKELVDLCGSCGADGPIPCEEHKLKFGQYTDDLANPYRT